MGGRKGPASAGGDFWSHPAVGEVIEELAVADAAANDLPLPVARVRVLAAAEADARAAARREVAAAREAGHGWPSLADALGLSRSGTMARYSTEARKAATQRQRDYLRRRQQDR